MSSKEVFATPEYLFNSTIKDFFFCKISLFSSLYLSIEALSTNNVVNLSDLYFSFKDSITKILSLSISPPSSLISQNVGFPNNTSNGNLSLLI